MSRAAAVVDGNARWPRWVRVAATPLVLLVAIMVPAGIAALAAGGRDLSAVPWVYVIVCAAVTAMAVVLFRLVCTRVDRRPFAQTGVVATRASVPLFLLGLLVSALVTAVVDVALTRAGLSRDVVHVTPAQFWAGLPGLLAAAFLLQGFPEELAFRGYVLSMFAERPVLALGVSSLVFGVIHLASSGGQQSVAERFLYLGPATAMGVLAGVLVIVTRSLWAAVGVHGGMHVGTGVAELFGAGSGPASWAGLTLVYLAVAGLAAWIGRETFRTPVLIDR